MRQKLNFANEKKFINALQELADKGIREQDVEIITPYPVDAAEKIIKAKESKVKYFAFIGAASGLFTGFAFTIYTVIDWPIITGGKPLISIPPFIIIAFELLILFGAVITFLGFLILSGVPYLKQILNPEEYGNDFTIIIKDKDHEANE